jgi:hypothetical protein
MPLRVGVREAAHNVENFFAVCPLCVGVPWGFFSSEKIPKKSSTMPLCVGVPHNLAIDYNCNQLLCPMRVGVPNDRLLSTVLFPPMHLCAWGCHNYSDQNNDLYTYAPTRVGAVVIRCITAPPRAAPRKSTYTAPLVQLAPPVRVCAISPGSVAAVTLATRLRTFVGAACRFPGD